MLCIYFLNDSWSMLIIGKCLWTYVTRNWLAKTSILASIRNTHFIDMTFYFNCCENCWLLPSIFILKSVVCWSHNCYMNSMCIDLLSNESNELRSSFAYRLFESKAMSINDNTVWIVANYHIYTWMCAYWVHMSYPIRSDCYKTAPCIFALYLYPDL